MVADFVVPVELFDEVAKLDKKVAKRDKDEVAELDDEDEVAEVDDDEEVAAVDDDEEVAIAKLDGDEEVAELDEPTSERLKLGSDWMRVVWSVDKAKMGASFVRSVSVPLTKRQGVR